MPEALAVVLEAAGRPPVVDTIEVSAPEGDEVMVRIGATGICHTDLSCAAGVLPTPYPTVLGHEAAGIVEEVGPDATRVRPGDMVVVSVAHHCGHCRPCETGFAPLCVERFDFRDRYRRGEQVVVQAYGTGTFTERTVLRERSVVRVPEGVPVEVAAVAGCAAATGLGAVGNVAHVPAGARVAVLGCGGVGMSTIMGAALAGAERIVAVDPDVSRRTAALSVGATDAAAADAGALFDLEPAGFDFVFESAGLVGAMQLALAVTATSGTLVLMGLPEPAARLALPVVEFVNGAKRLLGVNMGSMRPNVDFDAYFRLYLRGRLPLDLLVSERVPLVDAAAAFERARGAAGIRVMLEP